METIAYGQKVGTITYTSFPVFEDLTRLRPEVIKFVMVFFRMIGLGTPRQISEAIGESSGSDRVEGLLRRVGIAVSISDDVAAENMRETKECQEDILRGDTRPYVIDVSQIVSDAQYVHFNLEKTIRKLLTAQGYKGSPDPPKDSKFAKRLSMITDDKPEESQWVRKRPTQQEPSRDTSSLRIQNSFKIPGGYPVGAPAATSWKPKTMVAERTPGQHPGRVSPAVPEHPPAKESEKAPEQPHGVIPERPSEKAPGQPVEKVSERLSGAASEHFLQEKSEAAPETEQAKEPDQKEDPEATPEPESVQKERPEAISESVEESDDTCEEILDFAKACPLDPKKGRMDHRSTLNDKEYLRKLIEYFPLVTNEIIAKYLFNNRVGGIQVAAKMRAAGIKRQKGGRLNSPDNMCAIHQRAAFIAWAGGDWRTYLGHALAHAKDGADSSDDAKKLDRAIKDLAGHRQSAPPARHFEEIDKRTDPVPATVEKKNVLPRAKPIVYREGYFGATIDISTTAGRDKIEALVVYIMKEMPDIKVDTYYIYPDE